MTAKPSATDHLEVRWRAKGSDDPWSDPQTVDSASEIVVEGISGDQEFEVRAVSHCGAKTVWVPSDYTVPSVPVDDSPEGIIATGGPDGITLRWDSGGGSARGDLSVEIQRAKAADGPWVEVGIFRGNAWTDVITDKDEYWYRFRLIDYDGNAGPWVALSSPVSATTTTSQVQETVSALQAQINQSFSDVDDSVQQMQSDISDAKAEADKSKADLQTQADSLLQEVQDRKDGDTATLTNAKSYADTSVAAEKSARETAVAAANQTAADALAQEASDRKAAVTSVTNAYQAADSSLSDRIDTNTSAIGDNTSALQTEASTRASADSAEANSRETLAAQMRGDYTGNDLSQVTTGLIGAEKSARTTQYSGLAQQMTLLSAGVGQQFDSALIWYFDDGTDSWTGSGTGPTWATSWITPANGSAPYICSPMQTVRIVNGYEYSELRLRIKKIGNPTWAGKLWWKPITAVTFATGDGTGTNYQLNDGAGNDITANAQVSSIHQTDWQGRVGLSSEARTNVAYPSADVSGWGLTSLPTPTVTANAAADPRGNMTMTRYTLPTAQSSDSGIAESIDGLSVGQQACIQCVVRRDGNQFVILNGFGNGGAGVCFDLVNGLYQINSMWDAAGIVLLDDTFALIWGVVTPVSSDTIYIGFASSISGSKKAPAGAHFDIGLFMAVPMASRPGAYIPTTTAPVTVTDYSVNATGLITLGQMLSDGGTLDWTGEGDTANGHYITQPADFDEADSQALTEPDYDANGIGLVSAETQWASDLAQIKIQLSAAQSTTDGYSVDWVAIGRPAPGASAAALSSVETASAQRDIAEASARQALSVKLVGNADPSNVTLDNIASGLAYDEKQARVTADEALSSRITVLESDLDPDNTASFAHQITTQADNTAGQVSTNTSDLATLKSTVGNPTTGDTALAQAINSKATQTDINNAVATSEQSLNAELDKKADQSALDQTNQNVASKADASAYDQLDAEVHDTKTGLQATYNATQDLEASTKDAAGNTLSSVSDITKTEGYADDYGAHQTALHGVAAAFTASGDAGLATKADVQSEVNAAAGPNSALAQSVNTLQASAPIDLTPTDGSFGPTSTSSASKWESQTGTLKARAESTSVTGYAFYSTDALTIAATTIPISKSYFNGKKTATVTLTWLQNNYNGHDAAGMFFTAYASGTQIIKPNTYGNVVIAGPGTKDNPDLVWDRRSVSIEVPDTCTSVIPHIVMKRGAGTDNNGHIADIHISISSTNASVTQSYTARIGSDGTPVSEATLVLKSNGHVAGYTATNDGTTGDLIFDFDNVSFVTEDASAGSFTISGGKLEVKAPNGNTVVKIGIF